MNIVGQLPGHRTLDRLRSVASTLRERMAAPAAPAPGLHTYRETGMDGRQIRLHLRVDSDGSGVLFRDVTEVIHLNSTAVEMAHMALEAVSKARARDQILTRYRDVDRDRLWAELGGIYDMVEVLRATTAGCPTCALPDLNRADLFSTPVQAPFKADLALTYGCNNQCPHCYNEPDRYPMPSLNGNGWVQVVDRLHAVGVPHLILTGGEATLHPDLLHIIRYADGMGHIVGLNTNGRRLAHRPFMDQLEVAGLNHVQITLGSHRSRLHDAMMGAHAFRQTVRGIEHALASRVHTITNTTLMRANQDHATDIIRFLHALGIHTFAMNGMIHAGGGYANPNAIPEQEMPALLLRIRDTARDLGMRFLWYTPTEYCRLSPVELEIGAKRCNAAEYSICIEPNGDALPCQSYYVAGGNLLRDSWDSIWQGELFRSFRERVADPAGAGLPAHCWDCPDLPLCAGGCRLEREARGGLRVTGPSVSCSSCGRGAAAHGYVPGAALQGRGRRGSGAPVELVL